MTIPYHICTVEYLGGHCLRLSFADGAVGDIDLSNLLTGSVGPMFVPLQDLKFFAQVTVDDEIGTVVWPNGADLAPEVLHRQVLDLAKR